ncbi:hypothetical protein F6455_10030 [Proteobacteria bacterium 005FR1]|nr:hypothetical protein [Proteobacteria bacterium 005FR1]
MENQQTSGRVLLEVDIATLERLLARRVITVEEFRSVDRRGKHCLRRLFLSMLNRRLALQ